MADLSVPQFDVHGVRLVLEVLDLRADGPQVSLGRRRRRRRRRRGGLEMEMSAELCRVLLEIC